MRIVVPIIVFVAVAGFHHVISASLELHERTESPEESDELEYEAVHVKETEVLIGDDTEDGEKEVLTDTTTAFNQKKACACGMSLEHNEQAKENVESVDDITADQDSEYYDT
ncbi:uncharacterized protein si:dkey-200l5.4 [Xyrauchen texanus]|uniref:uncharacterized protein si:dkey-200l5.4 n=1 Tax=Xyrauchen texanus TaxID=154827 RepID=UPI002241A9D4|nr:uncharacterized protein si:dkey-200l5.4 [Xyrauchen texanus]